MKRQTLKEKIYHQIIDGIVSGAFKGGQVLTEQELMDLFQVSKAPVREALMILSSEGIVENIPRYGYRVISFTIRHVEDIMEFRSVVEDYMLEKSFRRLILDTSLNELKALAKDSAGDNCDVWQHWDSNTLFHLKLASFAENRYLYEQLQSAMNFLKLAYAQFYWSQWNQASIPNDLKHHLRIIQALEDKDLELAKVYLKKDLEDFCIR